MKIIRTGFFIGLMLTLPLFIKSQPALQWQNSVGGSGAEYAQDILQLPDGNYFVAGYSESNDGDFSGNHGQSDFAVAKLSSNGTLLWQKQYGGTQDEEIHSFVRCDDGSYILAGYTSSYDGDVTGNHGSYSSDAWIVKIDSAGTVLWKYTYGGSYDEVAYAVNLTTDGGIIVGGKSDSNDGNVTGNHGGTDYWIFKLNGSGILQWQKSYGGSSYEECYSVIPTADGGYLAGGRSSSTDGNVTGNHGGADCWLVKLDASGNLEWQKSYGGADTEEINSILQNGDGTYIFLGYTSSNNGDVSGQHNPGSGNDDFWTVKISNTGTLLWQKCYGGNLSEQAQNIIATSDGGYLLAGMATSTDGDVIGIHAGTFNPDYWVVKINSSGTLQWQKCLGGTDQDEALSIANTSDGGCVVCGFSYSTNGDITGHHSATDWWIVKLGAPAGMEENYFSDIINMYPSPAENYITVENREGRNVGIISVYNIEGKQMIRQRILQPKSNIDISGWQKGVYFLEIQVEGKTELVKFIKE